MMKKRRATANFVGILLAIAIMFAGIFVPTFFLRRQENVIIGKIQRFITENNHLVYTHPSTSPSMEQDALQNTDELRAKLYAWGVGEQNFMREPFDYEHTMEQAVESAKFEIGKLIDIGAMPSLFFEQFSFLSAELSCVTISDSSLQTIKNEMGGITLPANLGRWIIIFENRQTKDKITIMSDAQTGKIYAMEVDVHSNIAAFVNKNMLFMYAKYHNIPYANMPCEFTMNDTVLCIDGFKLICNMLLSSKTEVVYILEIEIQN
mgnify:CR=1 FL=1